MYIEEKDSNIGTVQAEVVQELNQTNINGSLMKTIVSSIQTTSFSIRNYYDVILTMMQRNRRFSANLSKAITFTVGKQKYMALSDISGNIVVFDMQNKNIETIVLQQYYATYLEYT